MREMKSNHILNRINFQIQYSQHNKTINIAIKLTTKNNQMQNTKQNIPEDENSNRKFQRERERDTDLERERERF